MGHRLRAIRARLAISRHARRVAAALAAGTDSIIVAAGLAVLVWGVSMLSTAAAAITAGGLLIAAGVGRMRA